MDERERLEAAFIAEILRIVGPGADPEAYAVAPGTSDELLAIRVQRLRELPSAIGHAELLRRVGPRRESGTTPALRIQLVKRADGSTTLRCRRRDGSETWQDQAGRHAGSFAFHDLRHYAVEAVLGVRDGFYGLIADGWDIDDTTGKGMRGPLPIDALVCEELVGLLDRERVGGGSAMSAAEVNAHLAQRLGVRTAQAVTGAQLDQIRHLAAELHDRWSALPAGDTLVLDLHRYGD